MAQHFLKLSFILAPTLAEAELLDECHELSTELADLDVEELDAHYDGMSDSFKAVFPKPSNETTVEDADTDQADPFATFRALFSDGTYPTFDCEQFGHADHGYWIAGDQADPHAIATLIQKCAPSVLPFGFEWTQSCDRLRPGKFGGGYYIVTADDIIGGSTGWLMQKELERLTPKQFGQTKVQKSVMTFTFLHPSSDNLADWSTDQILAECNEGAFVGAWSPIATADIPDARVESELLALGSDAEFFDVLCPDEQPA